MGSFFGEFSESFNNSEEPDEFDEADTDEIVGAHFRQSPKPTAAEPIRGAHFRVEHFDSSADRIGGAHFRVAIDTKVLPAAVLPAGNHFAEHLALARQLVKPRLVPAQVTPVPDVSELPVVEEVVVAPKALHRRPPISSSRYTEPLRVVTRPAQWAPITPKPVDPLLVPTRKARRVVRKRHVVGALVPVFLVGILLSANANQPTVAEASPANTAAVHTPLPEASRGVAATTTTTALPTPTSLVAAVIPPPPPPPPTTTTTAKPKPASTTTAPPIVGNSQTGIASYYQQPASYAANGCAHKTLPKGTVVTVTNLNTGKSTTCIVNDRGPYVSGRIIDLDTEVFERLAGTGAGLFPAKITW